MPSRARDSAKNVLPFYRYNVSPDLPSHELPFYLGAITIEGSQQSTHIHTGIEVGTILEGEGLASFYDEHSPIAPGDCYFTSALVPHLVPTTAIRPVKNLYAHISAEALFSLPQTTEKMRLLSVFLSQNPARSHILRGKPAIHGLLVDALESFDNPDRFARLQTWGILVTALCAIAREVVQDEPQEEATAHLHQDSIMSAVDYLSRNFSNEINLDNIAQAVSMSVSALCHSFTKLMGISPMQYRNKLRITSAVSAIVNTNRKIEQIAADLGFQSMSNFAVLFRKITGFPPSHFRK